MQMRSVLTPFLQKQFGPSIARSLNQYNNSPGVPCLEFPSFPGEDRSYAYLHCAFSPDPGCRERFRAGAVRRRPMAIKFATDRGGFLEASYIRSRRSSGSVRRRCVLRRHNFRQRDIQLTKPEQQQSLDFRHSQWESGRQQFFRQHYRRFSDNLPGLSDHYYQSSGQRVRDGVRSDQCFFHDHGTGFGQREPWRIRGGNFKDMSSGTTMSPLSQ
jgi:hypothetical protein